MLDPVRTWFVLLSVLVNSLGRPIHKLSTGFQASSGFESRITRITRMMANCPDVIEIKTIRAICPICEIRDKSQLCPTVHIASCQYGSGRLVQRAQNALDLPGLGQLHKKHGRIPPLVSGGGMPYRITGVSGGSAPCPGVFKGDLFPFGQGRGRSPVRGGPMSSRAEGNGSTWPHFREKRHL